MAKKAAKSDRKTVKGNGGETHQTAGGEVPTLTTKQGVPVADDQNTLTVGERGPAALEDFHFREKLFHFDHERIPERVVHARGDAARGAHLRPQRPPRRRPREEAAEVLQGLRCGRGECG